MRKFQILTIYLFVFQFVYSQNNQKERKVLFEDKCFNELKEGNYSFLSSDIIKYSYKRGNLSTEGTIFGYKKGENIKIYKVTLFSDKEGKLAGYYNCENLCDGIQKDYYKNGKVRLIGKFNEGKPIELKIYDEDGTLASKYSYYSNSFSEKRIDFFGINGKLEEYWEYKYEGQKTIIKQFNKKGKLIKTEIEENIK